MNYYLIIRPIIGASIGYITNWIAVKMLFRPLNPIKIGKFTLPFTPGIIPKNKERIAISIGNAISGNLLTEESLRSNLLSDEKKIEIRKSIENYIQNNNDKTIGNTLTEYISKDTLGDIENSITINLTENIFTSIKEVNIGNIISNQIMNIVTDKLKGSLLGMFGGKNLLASFVPEISEGINYYVDTNGKELISSIVTNEIIKIENKTISELSNDISKENIDTISIIMNIYEKIIIEKLPTLLDALNISKIVSDKIISMPTLEVEKLILEIMKKELNALVNLGALIGFILGLLNLLF